MPPRTRKTRSPTNEDNLLSSNATSVPTSEALPAPISDNSPIVVSNTSPTDILPTTHAADSDYEFSDVEETPQVNLISSTSTDKVTSIDSSTLVNSGSASSASIPSSAGNSKLKYSVKRWNSTTSSTLKMFQDALPDSIKFKEGMSVTEFLNGLNKFIQNSLLDPVLKNLLSSILNVDSLDQLTASGFSHHYLNLQIDGSYVTDENLLSEALYIVSDFLRQLLFTSRFDLVTANVEAFHSNSTIVSHPTLVKIYDHLGLSFDIQPLSTSLPLVIYMTRVLTHADSSMELHNKVSDIQKLIFGQNIDVNWGKQTTFAKSSNFLSSILNNRIAIRKLFTDNLDLVSDIIWSNSFAKRMTGETQLDFVLTMIKYLNQSVNTEQSIDPSPALAGFIERSNVRTNLTLVQSAKPNGLDTVVAKATQKKEVKLESHKKDGNYGKRHTSHNGNSHKKRKIIKSSDNSGTKEVDQFLPRGGTHHFPQPSDYDESSGRPWCTICGLGHQSGKHIFQNGQFVGPSWMKRFVYAADKKARESNNYS